MRKASVVVRQLISKVFSKSADSQEGITEEGSKFRGLGKTDKISVNSVYQAFLSILVSESVATHLATNAKE